MIKKIGEITKLTNRIALLPVSYRTRCAGVSWNYPFTFLLATTICISLTTFLATRGLLKNLPTISELAKHEGVHVSESALRLPKRGRLLCFVLTTPKYHASRVLAVNETWLPRCDHGQFFTSVQMDPSIPHSTVLKNIPDDYNYLFHKTMTSIHYAFTNVSDQFDWYFKADDDTYVIMEHMYEYLATLDPTEPYYLGYTLRPYLKRGYNGGGAGYVMSRAAVKLFLKRSFFNRTICPIDLSEDVGIGRCLENIEIYPHDTRNEKRQQRFNTYRPIDMFQGLIADEWHYYKQIKGHSWISSQLITLHHINPMDMRTYDDLLYRMRSPQFSRETEKGVVKETVLIHDVLKQPAKHSNTTDLIKSSSKS